MLHHNLDPKATLEVADPLENLRIRITQWLLPLGALAALAAWGFSVAVNKLGAVDRYLLWPMALGFLALEAYLLRNPHRIRRVWEIVLGMIALYEIATVFDEASAMLYKRGAISPALLWFPLVYLMAFVLLGRRQAFNFSLAYFALALVVGAIGLSLSPRLSLEATNSAVQFLFSNLTYILLLYIFAQLRRHYAQMHQMAHTDPLTGLTNRRAMQSQLEAEMERSRRYNRRFALILADIDHFKEVNDTHGHAVGDQVLREAAGRLSQHLRAGDQLSRWGGEEFLILAPETDLIAAKHIAERLHQALRSTPVAGIPITLSLGIACYQQGDSIATLLSRADEAMYRAKASGRDRIELEDDPHEPIIVVHTLPDTLPPESK